MNKGIVVLIETKLFSLIDITYQLIKTSIFFWVTLVKNFIFLGLTVSFCTLLEVIDEILSGNGLPIRKLFQDISPKYKLNKRLSLVTFGFIAYLSAFIIIPFPSSISINTALIIKFALLYILLLALVFFTYISWVLVKLELSLKKTVMYSFYLMMKHFFRSIILILMVFSLFYLTHMNVIFLIFLAPALYAFGVRLVLKKI
jgi:uncharacterized membrane protein YesL